MPPANDREPRPDHVVFTEEQKRQLDAASAERREELKKQFARDQVASDERAGHLSESLHRGGSEQKREVIRDEPEGKGMQVAKAAGAATIGISSGITAKMAKWVGYKLSEGMRWIEKNGQEALKPFQKYLKWIPFVGNWLFKEPEKTWKEQDEEWKKKYEAMQKKEEAGAKKGKEKKKKEKKLVESGLTKEQATAVLEGTAVEEKEEKEEKKAEKEEEKKEKEAA